MARVRQAVMALAMGAALAGCGTQTAPQATPVVVDSGSPTPSTPAGSATVSSSSSSASSSSTRSTSPSSSPTTTAADTSLRPGDDGARVRQLQRDLSALGYWLGTPDGTYGHLTSQAVMALQKSAGLSRDGIAGPRTLEALAAGTLPPLPAGPADRIDIDLTRQVLIVVRGGSIEHVINTSTASGETYLSHGRPAVAVTPKGTFTVGRVHRGNEVAPLGTLYSPRYFYGGYAVHGSGSIPGYPASHGCARVSNGAMDMIWSKDLMPVGSTVVVR